MIRRGTGLVLVAYSLAVLGGRSPAQAGSRCQEKHGTA
jgi:hypothetical protein